jgi:hypothetical protein
MVSNVVRFYKSHGVSAAAAATRPSQTRWLEEILGTIDEFGSASLELVAWELSLDEREIEPAWEQALQSGLIERTHTCPATNEDMYSRACHDVASPDPSRSPHARNSGRA